MLKVPARKSCCSGNKNSKLLLACNIYICICESVCVCVSMCSLLLFKYVCVRAKSAYDRKLSGHFLEICASTVSGFCMHFVAIVAVMQSPYSDCRFVVAAACFHS